jgi:hypothetical protein
MRAFDSSCIRRLAGHGPLSREFPFLTLTATSVQRVGCCGEKTLQPTKSPDYAAIKAAIAALPVEAQRRLLAVVGLTQARLIYRQNGKTIDITIG